MLDGCGKTCSTVGELLRERAREAGNEVVYIRLDEEGRPGAPLGMADLLDKASSVAETLRARGLEGKCVLLMFPAGWEYVVAFYGCMIAGTVAAPVNAAFLREERVRHLPPLLELASPSAILSPAALRSAGETLVGSVPALERLAWICPDELAQVPSKDWRFPPVDANATALLHFTSSTSGSAKACAISQRGLMANLNAMTRSIPREPGIRSLQWSPNYHALATLVFVLQPVNDRSVCYTMATEDLIRDPLRWIEIMSSLRIQESFAPNAVLAVCADLWAQQSSKRQPINLEECRSVLTGAEMVNCATVDAFCSAFGPYGLRRAAICPGYGMSEVGLIAEKTLRTELAVAHLEPETLRALRVKEVNDSSRRSQSVASVGRPIDGIECLVVDPETRTPCPEDRIGEIWLRGPLMAHGYWNNPNATRDAFEARREDNNEGPYLRTGDLGFMRNGDLYLTGRLKELIIIGGANYFPLDIETTAGSSHTAVEPSCACAFSVPGRATEDLVLALELRGASAQAERESDRHAAIMSAVIAAVGESYGLSIHDILLLDSNSLPRTPNGKLRRSACREAYLDDALPGVRARLLQSEGPTVSIEPSTAPADFGLTVRRSGRASQVTLLSDYLTRETARLLGTMPGGIDPKATFFALGIDSLRAGMLVAQLETQLQTRVRLSDLLKHPSIEQLTAFLADSLSDDPQSAAVESTVYEEESI